MSLHETPFRHDAKTCFSTGWHNMLSHMIPKKHAFPHDAKTCFPIMPKLAFPQDAIHACPMMPKHAFHMMLKHAIWHGYETYLICHPEIQTWSFARSIQIVFWAKNRFTHFISSSGPKHKLAHFMSSSIQQHKIPSRRHPAIRHWKEHRYSPVSNVDEELLGLNRSHQVGKACSFNLNTRQHNNKRCISTGIGLYISYYHEKQCCGSVTFWHFKMPNKKELFSKFFLLITFWRYIYIVFKDKSHKEVT